MSKRIIRKAIRLTPSEDYRLKEIKEASGLSESTIIRMALSDIKLVRSKPSKELLILLNKINNIGNNINQIARYANTFEELDEKTLIIYLTNLNSLVEETRKKYL